LPETLKGDNDKSGEYLTSGWENYLKKFRSFRKILKNKNLARLGDALINFAYSLAKSRIEGIPTGVKVQDKALAEAIRKTKLKKVLPLRSKEDALGDAVEALCAYTWLNQTITIEEMVETLQNALQGEDITHPRLEKKACTKAFNELLNKIVTRHENLEKKIIQPQQQQQKS
jgi:hypothetical protein